MKRGNSRLQIRRAGLNDARSIAVVLAESFAEHKASYTSEAFAATTPTADEIRNRANEGPMWIALSNEAIVGTASGVLQSEALYIRSMAILPSARGQHIGELMLQEIERFAARHGYKRLVLSTTPFLVRAIRLYQRFGFRRSSEGPHELLGTPLFTMVKNLSPQTKTPPPPIG